MGLSGADSLGPPQLGILRLEQIKLLGEEHGHHEEQEQHEGGRADGHTHHLEVGDDGFTARPLVPDVVLRVAPAATTGRDEGGGQAALATGRAWSPTPAATWTPIPRTGSGPVTQSL